MSKLHLGTIGWSYAFWKGPFYPPKTASKNFLAYYSSKFNSIEVDSTFYRMPTPKTVENWRMQTPDDFMFSLKFSQLITHVKALKDCQRETTTFLKRVGLLKEKLGPMLLQFPPGFTATRFTDLADYLKQLPKQHRYVVEVRHKSWLTPEFYSLLRENRVALAWAETAYKPETSEVTADFLYMRWEGDRKAVNGLLGKIEAEKGEYLQAWADRLRPFLVGGTEVFGYFGKYYSGLPPSDVQTLQSLLQ